jgi:hypothetical protein
VDKVLLADVVGVARATTKLAARADKGLALAADRGLAFALRTTNLSMANNAPRRE